MNDSRHSIDEGGISRTYPQSLRAARTTLAPVPAVFRGEQGIRVQTWWRSGCPGGLSARAWLIALPAWLLTWGALAFTVDDAPVLDWVLMGLSGFLVVGLVMLAGDPLVAALPGRLQTPGTVLVWAVAGAAGFAVALVLGRITDLAPQGPAAGSVIAAAVFAIAWLPVGGRFADAVESDARVRGTLLKQLARERALALQSARLVEADRTRLVRQTEDVVSEQLRKATTLSADPSAAATALQAVVDEVVRPLSRELEHGDVQEQALVEVVHTMGAVSPRPLREFRGALFHPGVAIIITTVFRVAISAGIVLALSNGKPPPAPAVVALGLVVVYTVFASILFLLASARTTASMADLSVAVEEAEWASSRLRQLAWSERERLGRSIHGDAQARIVATALQIQLGQHDDIDGRVRGLEQDIHALLAHVDEAADWRSVWDGILRVWEYSVAIDADIVPAAEVRLDADRVAARAVVSVMREALTNSVRHGHARNIGIELTLDGEDLLRLVVSDDGPVSGSVGEPGLGSRTMDSACHDWSLGLGSSGHTLIARIPTSGGVLHA